MQAFFGFFRGKNGVESFQGGIREKSYIRYPNPNESEKTVVVARRALPLLKIFLLKM